LIFVEGNLNSLYRGPAGGGIMKCALIRPGVRYSLLGNRGQEIILVTLELDTKDEESCKSGECFSSERPLR
jgi:hypothetical protein